MSAVSSELTIDDGTPKGSAIDRLDARAAKARRGLGSVGASSIAIVLAILWTIPTFGLLITSIRPQADIQTSGWWTWFSSPSFTSENYHEVLTGSTTNFSTFFVNSFVITIPSVLIPITLALLAAYAFAWIPFKAARSCSSRCSRCRWCRCRSP